MTFFLSQGFPAAAKDACNSKGQKIKYTYSFASPSLYSFGKTVILNGI